MDNRIGDRLAGGRLYTNLGVERICNVIVVVVRFDVLVDEILAGEIFGSCRWWRPTPCFFMTSGGDVTTCI